MFGSIGMPELIIIFVIALIIFGPRKLPELGPVARQEPGGVQAGVERAEEHARRGNPDRGAAARRSRRQGRTAPAPRRSTVATTAPPAEDRSRSAGRPERLDARFAHGAGALSRAPVRGAAAPAGRRRRRVAGGKMSFLEHLDELRKRIINAVPRHRRRRRRQLLLHRRDLQLHPGADAARRCPPGSQADLHAAGRSVLAATSPSR